MSNKINGNYYFSAVSGLREFRQAKKDLQNKYTLFMHEGYIDSSARILAEDVAYPLLSKGYAVIGDLTSQLLKSINPKIGERIQKAWYDPFSSETILTASNILQKVSEPLAMRKPVQIPILSTLDKAIIGLARFCDVSLKDVNTLLGLPCRVRKLFSKSPFEALVTERTSTLGRIGAVGVYLLYKIALYITHISLWVLHGFRALSEKIQHGTSTINWCENTIKLAQAEVNKVIFLNRIENKETEKRQLLIRHGARILMKRVLNFTSSAIIRGLFARTIILGSMQLSDHFSRFTKINKLAHATAEKITLKTLTGLNLLLKIKAFGAFFQTFTESFKTDYDPHEHSLFYGKNVFTGFYRYHKLKSYYLEHAAAK